MEKSEGKGGIGRKTELGIPQQFRCKNYINQFPLQNKTVVRRITGLNVSIMTQYEHVSRLATAIIVALVVILLLQCLVAVYLPLVKIKYTV